MRPTIAEIKNDTRYTALTQKPVGDVLDSLEVLLKKAETNNTMYDTFFSEMRLLTQALQTVFSKSPLVWKTARITAKNTIDQVHFPKITRILQSLPVLSEKEIVFALLVLQHMLAFQEIHYDKHKRQQANKLEFWEQAAFKGIQDTPNKMNFLDVAELAMPLIDLLVAKFNPVAKTADKATQSEETWPATTTNSWSDYLPSWPTRLTLWSSPATAPKSVAPAQETKPVSTLNA